MLSLRLEDFMIEVKDGSIKNVGAPTKRGEVKLYDIERAEAREFGDNRVKLVFEDDGGNEVQVALFPTEAETIRDDIGALADEGTVFE